VRLRLADGLPALGAARRRRTTPGCAARARALDEIATARGERAVAVRVQVGIVAEESACGSRPARVARSPAALASTGTRASPSSAASRP
jgi:hypothetical protein